MSNTMQLHEVLKHLVECHKKYIDSFLYYLPLVIIDIIESNKSLVHPGFCFNKHEEDYDLAVKRMEIHEESLNPSYSDYEYSCRKVFLSEDTLPLPYSSLYNHYKNQDISSKYVIVVGYRDDTFYIEVWLEIKADGENIDLRKYVDYPYCEGLLYENNIWMRYIKNEEELEDKLKIISKDLENILK